MLATAALAVLTCLAACDLSPSAAPTAAVVVRDSVGITIAEHSPPQVAALDVVTLDRPDLSIGALDGDSTQQLFRVSGVARLADGGIVLLNGGTQQVRFYDAAGRLVRTVGRQGSGPGEFAFPVALHRFAGDTVVVYDIGEQRWTWIAPDGETLRTLTAPNLVSGYSGFLGSTLVLNAAPDQQPARRPGVFEQPVIVRIEEVAGGEVDTIGQFGPWQRWYSPGGIVTMTQVPYTLFPVARPHDGEVYVLDGVSPEVRVYGSDAALRRILRLDATPRPVERAEFDRFVDSQIEEWRPPSGGEPTQAEAEQLRAIYNEMPLPAEEPSFDALVIARNGDVWLRDFELLPAGHRSWTVLDSAGSPVARVRTPVGFTMREAGADYVLGVFRDELDVEYVHLYRLDPS